eukprot:CAMPEP_0172504094 /NCGR_PEP_ID=MMETSP1066-20121228/175323_1 /TAXON_ID=671091 /ORGANISM="Coscinodiscus wailesii, Strain CCMP2513" /LENGTH=933 /DNA_ID=CAMNT_0013280107 /DNA_START=189 /DNA_END=2990 /DNA_ORIENTATION=-
MRGKTTTKILSAAAAATATICLSSTSSAVTPFISRHASHHRIGGGAPGDRAVGWVSSSRHNRDASYDLLSLRGGSTDVPAKSSSSSSKKKKKKKNKTLAKKDPKKKKKTAAAASVVAAEEPAEQHDDLSTAIMTKSAGKNSMQVYLYSDTDNHSLCALPSETMSSLNLFDGDTISIKGKRGKKTLGTCTSVDSTTSSTPGIGLSSDAMKNAGVRSGDDVTITPHPDLKFGKAVLILPYSDSWDPDDESSATAAADLFDDYLRPYFEGKFRTLHRGDTFHIPGPAGIVEFKCVEIDTVETDGDTGCVVVDDTLIECEGEALDRDDDVDDLADAGYDTIGGATKHLAAVRELVELPLRHPELWQRLGINPPRGVLLTGPSGCGKTVMARAVAAETGAYFFVINGPEVISKRAGESETNLRRAFEDAEQNSADYNGAIVFIDEIDSIAPRREKAGGEVEKRIVSQLLTLMDGLKPSSKVIVIAATNRPSVIEPALRRPGRFDRELDMGVPDMEGRLEILQIKTRDMRLGNDVDLEQLAKGTHGYVGADLQQLCMEAALECIRSKMGLIDFDKNKVDKAILDSIVVEGKHFDHALGIVHPSSLRENQVEVPDVHWGDVGGLEEVKRELHETVQYPVEHADKYVKFGMSPSKGVLFYGPPGCGKTLLAKAIANECGANFISIKGPELLTQWFGESEANVRELFDKARAASPCILMFDEMDSIAKARGSGGPGGSEAGDRVINQILTEIDGVGARKNVFVIGATNRPDILDPAVIRPGRLDQLIYIPLPDLASRAAIFKAALRKAPLDPDVDVNVLARSTLGFSGADITEVCQSASKLAIREAILEEEERLKKVRDGELEDDEGVRTDEDFVITKRHFNFAMSRARKSVSEKDLVLFEEFAEKQKAGRGDAATNFKFEDGGEGGEGAEEGDDDDLDLYG